ncbi:MAG: FxsA family protein [Thiohalomonadaceae bacterium]
MRLLHWLVFGILVTPLVELYFLIKVGQVVGPIPTIVLVVLIALAGAALMRHQGFSTLVRVRLAAARGEVPALEMMEGAVILFCGMLLLFPGFISDVFGLLGLIPPVRRAIIGLVLSRAMVRMHPVQRPGQQRHIIDGEFRREDD